MARFIENTVHVTRGTDLELEMHKHNCKTEEELAEMLWYTYGVILIIEQEDDKTRGV